VDSGIEVMMHRILISVLFGCTLCPGLWAQPSQKSYRRGDEEFASLNYQSAEARYDSLLRAMPDDSAAILWRLARVHVCMGEVEEGKQSEHHYRLAERHAHRAVQLDSMSADARTWYAAALGSVALHAGAKTKVQLAHEIRHEVDRAIALNPENDIAYAILGSFHRALAGLSWIERQLAAIFVGKLPEGDYEEGERALKKAIAINPRAARHHYELGLLYLDWDKPELARRMLSQVPILPVAVARDIQNKADAERRLEKLAAQ
jgi:tetratricopeptide (TPR) repeat protein